MPYIVEERRQALIEGDDIETAGEMNYLFTTICVAYMAHHGLNYAVINDILGALEGCKQEFYNRVVIPYEIQKAKENGDVYTEDTTNEDG